MTMYVGRARHLTSTRSLTLNAFFTQLTTQRWDDHRFYHQSRINQSLHLISALCFVVSYGLLFVNPAWAALLAWGVSMTTRQAGHFFFEPRGYDQVNQVTDAYKEHVKVGYNIKRKIVLLSAWAMLPVLLALSPSVFGLIEPSTNLAEYLHDVGMIWLALGVSGVALRVLQLWIQESLVTGLVWAIKIITDPFHDIALYWKSPLYLLRGELLDPMNHVRED